MEAYMCFSVAMQGQVTGCRCGRLLRRSRFKTLERNLAMKDPYSNMAVGIALGVGVGTALGIAFDDLAMGIGMGIAIGAGLGAALGPRSGK